MCHVVITRVNIKLHRSENTPEFHIKDFKFVSFTDLFSHEVVRN
jgi:hypothetical protein